MPVPSSSFFSLSLPDIGFACLLLRKLAAGPTVAYGAVRQSLGYSATHTLAESLAFEAGKMQLTGDTDDHRNAVASFVAKQKPTFEGR